MQEQNKFDKLPINILKRAGRQSYSIILAEEYKLAYFPIPKCACTSLKHLFFDIINQRPFSFDEHQKHVHQYFQGGQANLNIEQYKDYFKFTVIRDPIQRFVSGYRNRIIYHGDLLPHLDNSEQNPDINDFALQLETYISKSSAVSHHFDLQLRCLTEDLSIFDKIYPIEQLTELVVFLSQRVAKNLSLGRSQTGGPVMGVRDLSPEAFDKLLEFYAPDYSLLSDFYSIRRIKKRYLENE